MLQQKEPSTAIAGVSQSERRRQTVDDHLELDDLSVRGSVPQQSKHGRQQKTGEQHPPAHPLSMLPTGQHSLDLHYFYGSQKGAD